MDSHKHQQTAVRIPLELKAKLMVIAEQENWNFNQAMLEAVKKFVREYKQ